MKKLKITLEGKTYEVGVEVIDTAAASAPAPAPVHYAPPVAVAAAAPVQAPVAAVAAAPSPTPLAGGHSVTSPMPGIVMKIKVTVGQQVAKDDELVVLEAMKMESPIYAPCEGTVAAILVKETDSVNEGQVLIQLS
jgi:biotin carboxyl carrier protein